MTNLLPLPDDEIEILHEWGMKLYRCRGRLFPSATSVIRKLYNESSIPEDWMAFGTECHDTTAKAIRDGVFRASSHEPRVAKRVIAALDWIRELHMPVVEAEIPRISTHGFGFTTDVILDGGTFLQIVDWKFAASIKQIYILQGVVYAKAVRDASGNTPVKYTILRIDNEGAVHPYPVLGDNLKWGSFISQLNVIRFQIDNNLLGGSHGE